MPERKTLERARRDRREGKAPSTQAGEFIREQIDHIRAGKHGARSTKQAIAIGLSEARRSGVDLPPPAKGKASEKTRKSAARAYALGHGAPPRRAATPKRARASQAARKREGRSAASHRALSAQARSAAGARSASERSAAAMKAAKTKAAAQRSATAARMDAGVKHGLRR
jgi:hypothetical protein